MNLDLFFKSKNVDISRDNSSKLLLELMHS